MTNPKSIHRSIVGWAVLFLATPALGHPISLSEVVIDVRPKQATAEMRVMLEDLVLYYSLSADADLRYDAGAMKTAAEKHRSFLLKHLHLREESGRRLAGQVKRVDWKAIDEHGIPQSQLKKRLLTYVLEFAFDQPPKFLTIWQDFGGDRAVLPALMDCMVLQNGVLLEASQQLAAKTPLTVKLDWEHPPQKAKNWRELRMRKEKQRRQRLGIASYGGLYSFIYVTDHEARHEVLAPLLTLEKMLPLPRKKADFWEVKEQQQAKPKIASFFQSRNPVKVNGRQIKPVVSRIQVFGLDINDFAQNAAPRRVGAYQARVGVILRYPAKGRLQTVDIQWDTFDKYAPFLRSVVFIDDDQAKEHFFRPDQPHWRWRRPASQKPKHPIEPVRSHLSKGLRDRIAPEESAEVLGAVLKNVYRAFDYHEDGEIYDALAISVEGELLQKLYLQFKRSLLMAEQGGVRSRVETVKIEAGRLIQAEQGRFRGRCDWRVRGVVEHWGHIHTRENRYSAVLTVVARPQGWKIIDYRFADQKRLKFETRLRSAP